MWSRVELIGMYMHMYECRYTDAKFRHFCMHVEQRDAKNYVHDDADASFKT